MHFHYVNDEHHLICRLMNYRTWKPVIGLWVTATEWRLDFGFGSITQRRGK